MASRKKAQFSILNLLKKLTQHFVAAIICYSFIVFFINLQNHEKDISFIPKINFGIDIKGGSQLTVAIDDTNIIVNRYKAIYQEIDREINLRSFSNEISAEKIIISYPNKEKADIMYTKILNTINKIDNRLKVTKSAKNIEIGYSNDERKKIRTESIDKAIFILKNRIDSIGVKEIVVQKYSIDKLNILIPQSSSIEKIKRIISQTANLTFHLVEKVITNSDKDKLVKSKKLLQSYKGNYYYILEKDTDLTGEYIVDARFSNENMSNAILFRFNKAGARKFAQITSENIGKSLAIAIDSKVIMAPIINEPIIGGNGSITGKFSIEEANEISILLRSGSLPVSLNIIEEKNIDSAISTNAIKSYQFASLCGIIGVMFFMFLRYKSLGIIASVALLVNLTLTFMIMAIFGFTLTIPGIAGLILMLGMAVDANVLIYEKLRELQSLQSSGNLIQQAFSGAYSAIIDSNITTIVAAIALFGFGGSFIKGFAVTLIIGILCSIFTAVNLTKFMTFKVLGNKNNYNF
jgi:preprotein translocase subunit SecD